MNKLKNDKYDFVFASRYEKNCGSEDDTPITLIGNYIFTFLGKIFFKLEITDILYTFVMARTSCIKKLELKAKDFSFCVELPIKAKRAGYKLCTSKSFERSRIAGKKKVNAFRDGLKILFSMIKNFVKSRSNAFAFESLGQQKYFSCLKIVDLVIGNSSSGLIEVPAFKIPTINIGDRQRGRLKASSVIDCNPLESAITKSIKRGLSPSFRSSLKKVKNPYGKKGASSRIVSVLESVSFKNLLKKEFYNISF